MTANGLLRDVKLKLDVDGGDSAVAARVFLKIENDRGISKLSSATCTEEEIELLKDILLDIENVNGECRAIKLFWERLGLVDPNAKLKQEKRTVKAKRRAEVSTLSKAHLEELQDLADLITKSEQTKNVRVEIRPNATSCAHGSRSLVVMSVYHCSRSVELSWAVLIHEICHVLNWRYCLKHCKQHKRHGEIFKQYETKWLHEFGITPTYKRSYWKTLKQGKELIYTTKETV